MKKQFTFLILFSVLIFSSAIPFITNAAGNELNTTINLQDVGSLPAVPEVPTINVLTNTTYTYTLSLINSILLGGDISRKVSIVSFTARLPSSIPVGGPVVCPPNWEESNNPNSGRGVGMINCIESDASSRQYDITYGQTGSVTFTFTTPSSAGTTDLSLPVSYIKSDGLTQLTNWSPTVHIAVESPTCTSWTYSDWSSCSASGSQTRSIISSSPSSCTGGSPVINQSCTYTPPVPSCTATSWSCGSWGTCSQNGSQSRICDKNINCQGGVSSPSTSQSCTPPPSKYVCYPNCDARVCVNDSCNQSGYMKATVGDKISIVHRDLKLAKKITIGSATIDSWNFKDDILEFFLPDNIKTGGVFVNVYHSDGNLIADGTLTVYLKSTLPPQPSCTADTWTCGAWGTCSPSGVESRSCNKTFDCSSVETAPPSISQYCTPPNLEKYQISPADQQVVNQNNIIKATVNLWCLQTNEKWYSIGSGTIIDPNGTILTNKHVVADTVGCRVGFVESYKDEPYFGDRQIADIIKTSTNADIAVLKLRNPSSKILTYIDITRGSSDGLSLEDKIITYGYPTAFGTKITSTRGDFSGVEGDFLKTTAIIDKGNSGGGAYLQDGTFIGMPTKVFSGTFNVLGGILSVNKIKSWISGTPLAYNNESYNEYSRVSSVLENVDLKKLGTLKLFISDTDTKGNNITPVIAPTTNQKTQEATEQPQNNKTQKESTIIESTDTSQKINPEQNNSTSSEKGNDPSIKISEQRSSVVAGAVQEILQVAERDSGVGQQIKTIAQTQTQNQGELETSLQKVQSRGGLAKFFVGPDYGEINNTKKLLEQNREQIKQLDQVKSKLVNQSDQQKLTEQVQLFEGTNQQIETSLNEAQKGFSLLGWMFRLFAK